MFLYSNRTGYSFMPEVDMVSIIRLCVKMNSSSGTIRMMTLTAARSEEHTSELQSP